MYLNDLNSAQHNVKKLNRVLADTFNHEVDLSEMTTNAMERMLRATTTKMDTIKESDLKYWENPQYNKLGLIAHQLKTYITEIAPTRTDGKRIKTKESVVMEDELDTAEVLLAANELVDEMQGMVEDVAEMQVQKLMPIVDAMKEQISFEVAEAYNNAADAALGQLLDSMKTAKEALENATLGAQGKQPNVPAPTDMGAEEPAMDMDADMEAPDDFGGDDAEAGEDNPVGRELKGESALANMEKGALAEKKFLESKDRLFKMVESGKMTQEHFINIINQLNEQDPYMGQDYSKYYPGPKNNTGGADSGNKITMDPSVKRYQDSLKKKKRQGALDQGGMADTPSAPPMKPIPMPKMKPDTPTAPPRKPIPMPKMKPPADIPQPVPMPTPPTGRQRGRRRPGYMFAKGSNVAV